MSHTHSEMKNLVVLEKICLSILTCLLILTIPSCRKGDVQERGQDWLVLFDGKSFNGWRGLGRDAVPQGHWIIEDSCIKKVESGEVPLQADGQPLEGGDLMTVNSYRDFELYFEWCISEGGNSGVKYNVSEEMSTSRGPSYAALGFEYQVLDDYKHPDAQNPTHRAAALYDMIAPQNKTLKAVGEFNTSRVVFNGNHGEHWLNGAKVLEYDLKTAHFDSLLAESKYRDIPGFTEKRKGHIVLQDHTDTVWYRNIKIRVLDQQ
jgi:hypothetical protein